MLLRLPAGGDEEGGGGNLAFSLGQAGGFIPPALKAEKPASRIGGAQRELASHGKEREVSWRCRVDEDPAKLVLRVGNAAADVVRENAENKLAPVSRSDVAAQGANAAQGARLGLNAPAIAVLGESVFEGPVDAGDGKRLAKRLSVWAFVHHAQ